MRDLKILTISIFLFFAAGISCFANSFIQIGTLQAIFNGLYQSTMTVKEAKLHADTGIGCGVGLGELIAVDGYFFLADNQGYMKKLKNTDGISFFSGSKFNPTINYSVRDIKSMTELIKTINKKTKSNNIFYIIRVDGFFKQIYARSEDIMTDPSKYEPLIEWMKKHEHKFYFKDIEGTLIMVKVPESAQFINVFGYHTHFINNTRSVGGHVFDVEIENATVQIEPLYSMNLNFPKTKEFLSANLSVKDLEKASINKLETGTIDK